MNELVSKSEKTMTELKILTTAQVAEILNVSDRWVRNTIEKLRNNNSAVFDSVQFNKQGGYLLNEAQVTAIKLELQNHSKVNMTSPKTTLEKQLLIQQAMQLQAEMIAELQAENEAQKQRLAIAEPKAKWYDDFADCTGLIEIGVVGKHLEPYGLGALKIFDRLKADGIIYEKTVNGVKSYFAYFRYKQYFALRNGKYVKPDGKKIAYSKLMCTKTGAQWLESKYSRNKKKQV